MRQQHEITTSGPLLGSDGNLLEPGWARSLLPVYRRADIKAGAMRVKEWDYYLITDGHIGLALTMVCCIILGMGVPTTANYCIMASTCAPILIKMGIPVVAAHFFVFYFGIVADITPPVALAAYAGAAIAKANPMKTGINATKLAIAAFIVPYIFAYSPAMLFDNVSSAFEVVQIVVSALIGLFGVAAALNGFVYKKIPMLFRLAMAAGGLCMMIPGTASDVVGLVMVGGIVLIQRMSVRRLAA